MGVCPLFFAAGGKGGLALVTGEGWHGGVSVCILFFYPFPFPFPFLGGTLLLRKAVKTRGGVLLYHKYR